MQKLRTELFVDAKHYGLFMGSFLAFFNSIIYVSRDADETTFLGRYRGALAGGGASVYKPAYLSIPYTMHTIRVYSHLNN